MADPEMAWPFLGIQDLQKSGPVSIVAALFAEFLGALFIILLGCGSGIASNFTSAGPDLVQIRYNKKVVGIW